MSIQTELSRIINAKAAIKAAIEGKGVTVPDGTLLDSMASLIESIEAGDGSSVKDFYFSTITNSYPGPDMIVLWPNIPDVLVIVGPVKGITSADGVGLAIHIKDAGGGIYQEKWRYQSTKYLVGTSTADGSLFTLSKHEDLGFNIKINPGETSYGKNFFAVEYRVFAAKLF